MMNPGSNPINKRFCCLELKDIKYRVKDPSKKGLMACPNPIQPHIRLDKQRNQLYQFALNTTRTWEELERSWNTLLHEELILDF